MLEQHSPLERGAIYGAALGLVASGALHTSIEVFTNEDHGWRADVSETNLGDEHTVETDLSDRKVGEPFPETLEVGSEVPGATTKKLVETRTFIGALYAKNFSEDPNARRLDLSDIAGTVDRISELQAEGWDVKVIISGSASAEDESQTPDGGVQSKSDRNGKLAGLRRDTLGDALDPLLEALPEDVTVERSLPNPARPELGDEDEFTDTQVLILTSEANKYGYTNIKTMIDQWNADPSSSPDSVNMLLERWLGDERNAKATLIATRLVPGETITETSEVEVCIQPIIDRKKESTYDDPYHATIPYGLAITVGTTAVGLLAGSVIEERDRQRRRQVMKAELAARRQATKSSVATPPKPDKAQPPLSERSGCMWPRFGRLSRAPKSKPVDLTKKPLPTESSRPLRERPGCMWPRWDKRLLWLIPIGAGIVGAGLLIDSCVDDDSTRSTNPTPPAVGDPCAGLEKVERVVGTETLVYDNGRLVATRNTG